MIVTNECQQRGIFVLLYGKSGVGKTPLAATAPSPFFIDTEGGMMWLDGKNIPRTKAKTKKEVKTAIKELHKKKYKHIKTVVWDSISKFIMNRIVILEDQEPNKMQAYGVLIYEVMEIIELLEELMEKTGKAIVVIGRCEYSKVGGYEKHRVQTAGQQLPGILPHEFDEVFALMAKDDEEGENDWEEGKVLLTQPTEYWDASDRSGALKKFEALNLTKIFNKIEKSKAKKGKKK